MRIPDEFKMELFAIPMHIGMKEYILDPYNSNYAMEKHLNRLNLDPSIRPVFKPFTKPCLAIEDIHYSIIEQAIDELIDRWRERKRKVDNKSHYPKTNLN